VLDIQRATGMECDFLGAWRMALDSVGALGTARNVFVDFEDQTKREESDSDDTYKPYRIYRRSELNKRKKIQKRQERGRCEGGLLDRDLSGLKHKI
jgi:hypothetical protein